MIWSWYISLESQFCMVASIVLLLARNHPRYAAVICSSFFISSIITTTIIRANDRPKLRYALAKNCNAIKKNHPIQGANTHHSLTLNFGSFCPHRSPSSVKRFSQKEWSVCQLQNSFTNLNYAILICVYQPQLRRRAGLLQRYVRSAMGANVTVFAGNLFGLYSVSE